MSDDHQNEPDLADLFRRLNNAFRTDGYFLACENGIMTNMTIDSALDLMTYTLIMAHDGKPDQLTNRIDNIKAQMKKAMT